MTLLTLATVVLLCSALCSVFIHVHAFRRSVGSGVMTLFVPGYVVFYAFSQFEHGKKGAIVCAWLGLGMLGAVLAAGALRLALGA